MHGPDGHGLQELQGGRSPKRLDRIFSKFIFLNLLKPLELPIPLVALLELEKLTAIQLGCDKLMRYLNLAVVAVNYEGGVEFELRRMNIVVVISFT